VASGNGKLSPAMRQYQAFKDRHPDYVLFFRMGDFYEMFHDDAQIAHRVMGVTLTSRNGVPMAGVPHHSIDGYLRKMIAAGHRVAMCEQVQDAKEAKGVVERDVTRLVTAGTLTDDHLLDGRSDNYLAAYCAGESTGGKHEAALAWVELSTGELHAMTAGGVDAIADESSRLAAAETLLAEQDSGQPHPMAGRLGGQATDRPAWQFTASHAAERLKKQWGVSTAEGFGFGDGDPAMRAVGALLAYLEETQKSALAHVRPPRRHDAGRFLRIDAASYRALEIDRTSRSHETAGSLLHAIDRTKTAMGGRLLRRWVRLPLADVEAIIERQENVAALLDAGDIAERATKSLENICDVERIVGRLAVGRALPRDLAALGRCLAAMPNLLDALAELPIVGGLREHADFAAEQAKLLKRAIKDEPAAHLREGNVMSSSYDDELKRLRNIGRDSQKWLVEYQAKLTAESDIGSLKVGYNKVFGYYIEVTNAHKNKVPAGWTRKQTLKDAERYITPELKEFEGEALTAQDRAIALEQELFEKLRRELLPAVPQLQKLAERLAELDVLLGLATLARERGYCRPTISADRVLHIEDGRHPVLEQQLGPAFVANDVAFAEPDCLKLITGPNMAGKSTFIRQIALVTILAQIGSYVPAKSATIGVADRLFARIGASDEIHAGQSTFMVEMLEAANVLNNATDRSLVILDEIGRGTSTLDGLSLAWAIAEQLATKVGARSLFATHYHELTALAEQNECVGNLNVAVREWQDEVVFLHRIVPGRADKSYGIHVARLAGVPRPVLDRAGDLLRDLSVEHGSIRPPAGHRQPEQLSLFADPDAELGRELREKLAAVELDDLSPRAAHDLVQALRQIACDA
jgi:DNA mismatch repair protein MutS